MEVSLKKCVRCNKEKPLIHFEKGNKLLKMCDDCRERDRFLRNKNKCKHGKRKNRCRDCRGSGICEHGKLRHRCKECGGSSFCEHDRIRYRCRDCGGAQICSHNIEKRTCKICDPLGHLVRIVRCRVHRALRNKKSKSSIEYLGYPIDEYKDYIASQFKEGMSWENYGTVWHIDHIIPLKYNNPSFEETLERLHYTNTQPLWADENLRKGNRYIG